MRNTNYLALIIWFLVIALPFILQFHSEHILMHEMATAAGGVVITILLLLGCVWRALKWKTTYSWNISLVDILVVSYLLYGAVRLLFNGEILVEPIVLCRWGAIFCGYCLVRVVNQPNSSLWAIVISGFIQAVVAFGQYFQFISVPNIFFSVTGSFGNPGQLGGFLAVALAIAIGLLSDLRIRSKRDAVLLSVVCVVIGGALLLSDSRASWLAVIIAIAFTVCRNLFRLSVFSRNKLLTIATMAVLLVVGCTCSYLYKKTSADGRLLIWQVSAGMIGEKPLFGHGVSSFPQKYMTYQADYFARNPESGLEMVADNVTFCFNEYIHLTVEQGITGFLLLLALLCVAFFSARRNPLSRIFRAGLIALSVFSFFSYPATIFPILFLFAIFIGNLQSESLHSINIPRWVFVSFTAFLVMVLVYSMRVYRRYDRIPILLEQVFRKDTLAVDELERDGTIYNPMVNDTYVLICSQTDMELRKSIHVFPSTRFYCALGQKFLSMNQYGESEKYLKTAVNMIPHLMMPRYYLWQLYLQKQDSISATRIANTILNQQIKVENTFTIRTRKEVKQYLQALE